MLNILIEILLKILIEILLEILIIVFLIVPIKVLIIILTINLILINLILIEYVSIPIHRLSLFTIVYLVLKWLTICIIEYLVLVLYFLISPILLKLIELILIILINSYCLANSLIKFVRHLTSINLLVVGLHLLKFLLPLLNIGFNAFSNRTSKIRRINGIFILLLKLILIIVYLSRILILYLVVDIVGHRLQIGICTHHISSFAL